MSLLVFTATVLHHPFSGLLAQLEDHRFMGSELVSLNRKTTTYK